MSARTNAPSAAAASAQHTHAVVEPTTSATRKDTTKTTVKNSNTLSRRRAAWLRTCIGTGCRAKAAARLAIRFRSGNFGNPGRVPDVSRRPEMYTTPVRAKKASQAKPSKTGMFTGEFPPTECTSGIREYLTSKWTRRVLRQNQAEFQRFGHRKLKKSLSNFTHA